MKKGYIKPSIVFEGIEGDSLLANYSIVVEGGNASLDDGYESGEDLGGGIFDDDSDIPEEGD